MSVGDGIEALIDTAAKRPSPLAVRPAPRPSEAAGAGAEAAQLLEQLAAFAAAAPGVVYSLRASAEGWVSVPFAGARLLEVLGLHPEAIRTDAAEFLKRIHREDVARIATGMIEAAEGELRRWTGAFRFHHPSKGRIWVESYAVPVREPGGATVWHGYLHDVSERIRAEEALRESHERHRAFFESPSLGAAEFGLDLRFRRVNSRLCQMTGYTEAELLRMGALDLWPPEVAAEERRWLQRQLTGESAHPIDKPLQRKDGSRFWARFNASILRSPGGDPLYIVAFVDDITERKQTEEAFRASLDHLRRLVEQAPVSIAMFDRGMNYIAASEHYLREFGRGRTQLVGLHHYDVNPDLPQRWKDLHQAVLAGQSRVQQEDGWIDSDGIEHVFHWSISPWTDETGAIAGVILLTEDVGTQRRAAAAMRESEERLRQIGEDLPDSVVFRLQREPDGHIHFPYVSGSVKRVMGLSPAQVVEDPERVLSFVPESQRGVLMNTSRETLEQGGDISFEMAVTRADGDRRWLQIHSRRKCEQNGSLVWDGVATDVTERKQAEAVLRQNEERFRQAFEHASVGFVVARMDGRILDANRAFCRLTGFSVEEVREKRLEDFVHSDDRAEDLALFEDVCARRRPGYVREHRYVRSNGDTIWVRKSTSLTLDNFDNARGVTLLVEDIGERKKSEEAFAHAFSQLRAVLDGAKEAIISLDEEGVIQSINAAGVSMFGYGPEEAIGKPIEQLLPSLGKAAIRQERPGAGAEFQGRRSDGTIFPIEASFTKTRVNSARLTVGFVRDLSERRRIESEIEKLTSQRLSAMGGMAAALAHELNQPLATIGLYLETARLRLRGREPSALSALDKALDQVMRAGQVVSHFREFVAHGEPDKTHQSVHALVREVLQTFAPRPMAEIAITLDLAASDNHVLMDKVQIGQVLINLLRNAREALNGAAGGRITISTTTCDESYIRISVSDNGPGLPADVKDRLFEPLVTTKPAGKGIGLSICKSIVEAHYGRIYAEDRPEGGAQFHFTLPLANAEPSE